MTQQQIPGRNKDVVTKKGDKCMIVLKEKGRTALVLQEGALLVHYTEI